jgi:hypothetical protein
MSRAVEKLIWDNKIQGLVFFLQRTHRRHRHDSLNPKLLESMNIGPEIEFARKDTMPAPVPRQKGDLAALEHPAYIRVRRRAERRLHADLFHLRQSGHRIKPAAANNPYFHLWQCPSRTLASTQAKLAIIQERNLFLCAIGEVLVELESSVIPKGCLPEASVSSLRDRTKRTRSTAAGESHAHRMNSEGSRRRATI